MLVFLRGLLSHEIILCKVFSVKYSSAQNSSWVLKVGWDSSSTMSVNLGVRKRDGWGGRWCLIGWLGRPRESVVWAVGLLGITEEARLENGETEEETRKNEGRGFYFLILPRAWLALSPCAEKHVRGTVTPWENRWSQPPLHLSSQKEVNVQPLVSLTWFIRQSGMIRGSVPTLPPGQAVRPTVPYFLSIELLLDFPSLFRKWIQIPFLWTCLIPKTEVTPALAISCSLSHNFSNHHTTHLWVHFLFSRAADLILVKKYLHWIRQVLPPVWPISVTRPEEVDRKLVSMPGIWLQPLHLWSRELGGLPLGKKTKSWFLMGKA